MLITDINLIGQRKNTLRQLQFNSKRQGLSVPECDNPYIAQTSSCNVDNKNAQTQMWRGLDLYLGNDVSIGDIHEIPATVKHGLKYKLSNFYLRHISAIYKVEDNKGVNIGDPRARKIDICLAKYAQKVAGEMDVSSACYTGVKHALWASGVIDDYSDMPKGSAYRATEYFNAHPEKFERLNISLSGLKQLPAGYIVVYKKEGYDGHVAVTNGYGQEMSDCTDNMKWVERRKQGATFTVYRLTDNWQYNPNTKKLEFHS